MKIIYQPKGAAGEYAKYAVNFVVGCEYGCKYCYNRKGVASGYLGGDPRWVQGKNDYNFFELVKQFSDDVKANLEKLRKDGVFFSFTSDPLQDGWKQPTYYALQICDAYDVPAVVLTKNGKIHERKHFMKMFKNLADKGLLKFGVTLTGYDDWEGNAPSNGERVEALKAVKALGAKTWVSLEPMINEVTSLFWLENAIGWIDEVRIGLLTPVKYKNYSYLKLETFRKNVNAVCMARGIDVYWKRSFIDTLEKLKDKK